MQMQQRQMKTSVPINTIISTTRKLRLNPNLDATKFSYYRVIHILVKKLEKEKRFEFNRLNPDQKQHVIDLVVRSNEFKELLRQHCRMRNLNTYTIELVQMQMIYLPFVRKYQDAIYKLIKTYSVMA